MLTAQGQRLGVLGYNCDKCVNKGLRIFLNQEICQKTLLRGRGIIHYLLPRIALILEQFVENEARDDAWGELLGQEVQDELLMGDHEGAAI